MKKAWLAAGFVLSISATAAADSAEIEAKKLFAAGAEAYASGQFDAAIQAFSEAQRILPRPAIIYSLGQAHRQQYAVDRKPEHVRVAVQSFRAYLDQVREGGRRADAAKALMDLEPLIATMGEAMTAPAAAAAKEPARLMITSQPTGAWVTIDGKDRKQAPYAAEVTPGKHRIHVSLAGHFDDDREVLAVDRALVPIPVELRARPAHLTVSGPGGCEVTVDGRPAGTTPLAVPVELTAGSHLVVVTKNGYKAFSREVDVARDENKSLAVTLEPTGQRVVAYSLFLSGGALVLAGGAFSLIALEREGAAKDILKRGESGNISSADRNDYLDARDARDGWTTGAVAAFAVGGAALLTGLVFYAFDRPTVSAPPRGRPDERRPAPSTTSPGMEPTEMTFAPVVSPTVAGAGISGRF
jgi:hypothetical protein